MRKLTWQITIIGLEKTIWPLCQISPGQIQINIHDLFCSFGAFYTYLYWDTLPVSTEQWNLLTLPAALHAFLFSSAHLKIGYSCDINTGPVSVLAHSVVIDFWQPNTNNNRQQSCNWWSHFVSISGWLWELLVSKCVSGPLTLSCQILRDSNCG